MLVEAPLQSSAQEGSGATGVARPQPRMQRLYLQFYVTVLLVLAVFVGAAGLAWKLTEDEAAAYLDIAAELTGALLPEADAPPAEVQKALETLNRKLRFDLSLYGRDGTMIAMVGRPPPRFDPRRARTGWRRGPGGPTFACSCRRRWRCPPGARAAEPDPVGGGRLALRAHIAGGAYPWCAASAAGSSG